MILYLKIYESIQIIYIYFILIGIGTMISFFSFKTTVDTVIVYKLNGF